MEMPEEFEELRKKIAGIVPAMPVLVKSSFEQIKPAVEDANIAQLDKGERADGTMLPNYSFVSVGVYGKKPGPMNLHDTGEFWRGITLEVYDDSIELVGRDIKTQMLQLRYGDEILGLSEESQDSISEDYLAPVLETEVEEYFEKP
jgi:hypothetical protein